MHKTVYPWIYQSSLIDHVQIASLYNFHIQPNCTCMHLLLIPEQLNSCPPKIHSMELLIRGHRSERNGRTLLSTYFEMDQSDSLHKRIVVARSAQATRRRSNVLCIAPRSLCCHVALNYWRIPKKKPALWLSRDGAGEWRRLFQWTVIAISALFEGN